MRVLLLCIVLFSTLIEISDAQQTAQGVVFLDENQNGQMDAGEAGIQKVPVSNGEDVVLTDGAGRYRLPVNDDTIIFIIKPTGYRLPVNRHNLPQFYYIHKPQGSPELKYAGVPSTGPLPESINFGLIKEKQSEAYDILVFGDPQPYTMQEVQYFDQDITTPLANSVQFEFGISLGDLVGNDLDLFDPYIQAVSRIGIPWFNVYGNHDMNFDAESDRFADETFEATFGPATYAFNQGKVHFIILDDVVYPRTDGKRGYIGGLTEQQLNFIENDLQHVPKDHLVVVAFHIPPFSERFDGRTYRFKDQKRLFELLSPYENTLSLSAHTHVQEVLIFNDEEGWQGENPHIHYNVGTTSGDWWSGVPDEKGIPDTMMRDGTPNGYAVLRFDGNQFTFDYFAARADTSHKMNMWGPRVVPHNTGYRGDLYVNYFLGSDKTKVEYKLPGRKWRTMRKIEEGDPVVAAHRYEWDTADEVFEGVRPNNPVTSSHLWKARIPAHLPLGRQKIEVRVTDIFDRIFTDDFVFEVVEKSGSEK